MNERRECPVCGRWQRVNKDGRFRKHERDTTVRTGERTIYSSEPCGGSGEIAETVCDSCGRPLSTWPDLKTCLSYSSHECGHPTFYGPCIRPWDHSPYRTKHIGRDA